MPLSEKDREYFYKKIVALRKAIKSLEKELQEENISPDNTIIEKLKKLDRQGADRVVNSEVIVIDRKEFRKLMNRISSIEQFVRDASKANTLRKWISEEEAMSITGLGKRSLGNKRAKGEFTWSSATGRKIKYLRTEIENYLNDNSTR